MHKFMCGHVKSLKLCLTLCDPVDLSPPGSSVHGILQARILEWVAVPSSRESLMSPALAGRFFTPSATWEAHVSFVYTYIFTHEQVGDV